MKRPRPSQVVLAAGFGSLLLGALLVVAPWYQAAQWQTSPQATLAARNAAAPTPVWMTPTPVVGPHTAPTRVLPAPPTPVATLAPVLSAPIALDARIAPQPTATPSTSDLRVGDSAFAFDDPPQPGARAHLDLTLENPTERENVPILVDLPTRWLSGYELRAVDPTPQSGLQLDGKLRLAFDAPPPEGALKIHLEFVTTDEVIDAPSVTVTDADGRAVGKAQPSTQAPPAAPGPIYSIDIPRLNLHSGVVPVEWEPPLFVVGQLRTSAWVTRGNSVLVGHVRGAAGYNVFIHLDQLEPGDEIVARSRGQSYTFIVDDKQILPEDDIRPTDPTRAARLTLMTCAGDWNPLTQDYSDRLWVIARPAATPRTSPTPLPLATLP
jgi:hypothetical protein